MKTVVICQECHKEMWDNGMFKVGEVVDHEKYMGVVEINKWPLFEFKCRNGHRQRFALDIELYELLFQQATYCIMDGYYREAISTYNTAIERFFEYVIEILWLNKNKDLEFDTFWKAIRNQSERQLGAYYALWAISFGENPDFLDEKMVGRRNAVVHKGGVASREEAMDFGKAVFDYIKKANGMLEKKVKAEINLLRAMRKFRILRPDIEKTVEDPIVTNIDGEELYKGVGSNGIKTFLNSKEIYCYEACFEQKVETILDLFQLLK